MILDSLQNFEKYKSLHPLFPQAFDYIFSQDFNNLTPGNTEVDGDRLKAIAIESRALTTEESTNAFECHNKYIDIQVCLTDGETIGWKNRQSCNQLQAPYDENRDVAFYNDAPDTFFTMQAGQFVIFYPEDVHAPMINPDGITLKKLVMKVKI